MLEVILIALVVVAIYYAITEFTSENSTILSWYDCGAACRKSFPCMDMEKCAEMIEVPSKYRSTFYVGWLEVEYESVECCKHT